jgi:Cu(I)/Ag(I) efflux system membrane fusion protein
MKTVFTIVLTAALAATGTWLALQRSPSGNSQPPAGGRTALYYQSAMHPWIKSDRPGRCTICGMELTPVYEGEPRLAPSADENVVPLTPSQIRVLNVQTARVERRPLVRTLRVAGTIDDNATRHRVLSAYVDGRIDRLHVNFIGAEVTENQPLAEIYSPTLLQAEREFRQLTGALKQQSALRLRQLGLTPAQIAAVDQKPADALTSPLLAPMSGTVVSQSVFEGQYVSTGQPLFEITDFSTMWFMFRAYEQDLPWIRTGLNVDVHVSSVPGQSFTGPIAFIDPNVDAATRSTAVRVELPNPLVDGRRALLHRVYAEGVVALEAPVVLSVPRTAVIETGRHAVVYVDLGGGAYAQRGVKTGMRGDSRIEVLSGVAEGEAVVIQGNLLIDGQAEMNRAFLTPVEALLPGPALAAPDAHQRQSVAAFIKVADAMAAALAQDDLPAFNTASRPAMEITGALIEALGPDAQNLDALDRARHFHGFDDLASARAAFHAFSVAAVAALDPWRQAGPAIDLQIYECGMVDQSIPGAPKKARWIQAGGRRLANPFFGAAMLECGQPVHP